MMHFQITPGTGVPSYRQIMEQVSYYVASGTLQAGDALPSIRELARAVAVNPSTVVKAYNELAHEGVIVMRQGKGAFIAESARRHRRGELRAQLRKLTRKLAVETRQLGIDPDEVVEALRRELEEMAQRAEN